MKQVTDTVFVWAGNQDLAEVLAPGGIRIAKCPKKKNRKILLGFHMINTLWDLPKELQSKPFKIGSIPAGRHVSNFLSFELKRKLKTSARSGLYQPTDQNPALFTRVVTEKGLSSSGEILTVLAFITDLEHQLHSSQKRFAVYLDYARR